MELIHPEVEAFAERYTSQEDPLLQQIHLETAKNHAQPHMLSGHVQGQFLRFFSQLLRPKYILEIGTFTGYSALCLAEGLVLDGELHTIELREADVLLSKSNIAKSHLQSKIHVHQGNALDIIPQLNFQWDMVFIDADKVGYIDYYNLVLDQLSPNGCILADNVLFHGQILEQPVKGKSAKAIQAFNEYLLNDDRTEQVALTIRDGLFLIKKKK